MPAKWRVFIARTYGAPFLLHASSSNSKCHVHLRLGHWVICRTARQNRVSDIRLVGLLVQHWTVR